MFHLEKLKDLSCAHEYAVIVSNQFQVLDALEDRGELWHTFKRTTLEVSRGCIGGHPSSRRGFALVETLDSIERNHAARLARNRNQYRSLSRRTSTLLRRDKGC